MKMANFAMEATGYLYCFSNRTMPGVLKIGMTEREPQQRLKEANTSDTWRPPTPYVLEFAKKVKNPKYKETLLHTLLSQYTERINPKREFFRVSSEEVNAFFNLMDGDYIVPNSGEETVDDYSDDDTDELAEGDAENAKSLITRKGPNDMSKYFTNGQKIRHTIGINKTWVGVYNTEHNGIIYEGDIYKSLSGFVNAHHRNNGTYKNNGVSGWRYAECECNGEWVSVKEYANKIPI